MEIWKVFLVCVGSVLAINSAEFCEIKDEYTPKNSKHPFELPELPYPRFYLYPVLTSEILHAHHDKHHQSYVTKLNKYLDSNEALQNKTLLELVAMGREDLKLERFAGGHYNHMLYWWVLNTPYGDCKQKQPGKALMSKILEQWETFEDFKTAFENNCLSVFGSGWSWLCVDKDGKLKMEISDDHVNPLMHEDKCYPILTNDAWEHAYYLKYKWDKGTYFNSFWKIVDWQVVDTFYENYASKQQGVPF